MNENTLFYEGSGVDTGHEGLILLILHIHMYFRYNKTKKNTSKWYRILVHIRSGRKSGGKSNKQSNKKT